MEIKGEATLLRIYTSNTDKFKHNLLYEMVVYAARRYGLAGATVLKGTMGYGSSSVVHSNKFWQAPRANAPTKALPKSAILPIHSELTTGTVLFIL